MQAPENEVPQNTESETFEQLVCALLEVDTQQEAIERLTDMVRTFRRSRATIFICEMPDWA